MAKKTSKKDRSLLDLCSPIITDLSKLCYDNGMLVPLHYYILNDEKQVGYPWTSYTPIIKKDSDESIILYITNDNYEKYGDLTKIYISYNSIPIVFLEALLMVLPKYFTLTTLKLEYCNLSASEIAIVSVILNEFRNIFDVSLDGNPNNRQNFAMVLTETSLRYLSLKRCKIREFGMQKICEKLWYTNNDSLITLNLTGNYIDDDAVTHLAKMLRQNRILRMINLSDNWITDTGCSELMKSLQHFALTPDEIFIKRKEKFNYYKLKATLTEEFKREQANNKFDSSLSLDTVRSLSSRRTSSRKDRKTSSSTLSRVMLFEKHLNLFLEENLPQKMHPFVSEVSETMGMVLCNGNFILSNINLRYNKISTTGFRNIINTLNYQYFNNVMGEGLTFIDLDGNSDISSSEYYDIYRILMEKKRRCITSAASQVIINRRTSSKYSSTFKYS